MAGNGLGGNGSEWVVMGGLIGMGGNRGEWMGMGGNGWEWVVGMGRNGWEWALMGGDGWEWVGMGGVPGGMGGWGATLEPKQYVLALCSSNTIIRGTQKHLC